jgi:hypothetical protein
MIRLAFLILAFFAFAARGQPFPIPATQPTTRPVAVWYQPAGSHGKWSQRGCSRLIGYESEGNSVTLDVWCASAKFNKQTYFLQVAASAHWSDAQCEAVLYNDEPNDSETPGQTTDGVLAIRSSVAYKRSPKPIFGNLDGWKLQWQDDATIAAYCAPFDWLGMDWYLANHGEGLGSLNGWKAQIARLQRLAPGKKLIIFIEASDQNLRTQSWAQIPVPPQTTPWAANMHGPTVLEMQTQYNAARAMGCDVAIFSQTFTPFKFDAIGEVNAGAMTAMNLVP